MCLNCLFYHPRSRALKQQNSTLWTYHSLVRKALLGFFLFYFQLPYLLEETCFQQAGSSAVEGTNQAVMGSCDQLNVPTTLSLFLKSENIPALLYVGKGAEYRPFRDFPAVPSAKKARAQI
jgi:hypothetical protein